MIREQWCEIKSRKKIHLAYRSEVHRGAPGRAIRDLPRHKPQATGELMIPPVSGTIRENRGICYTFEVDLLLNGIHQSLCHKN